MKAVRLAAVAVIILLITLAGGVTWWRWSGKPVGGTKKARIVIARGASAAKIGDELTRRGIIRSSRGFSLRARWTLPATDSIKPGVYDVASAESPSALLRRFVNGDVATMIVTFPEGFTVAQVAARLADRKLADQDEVLRLVTREGRTFKAAFPLPENLEGYLFPDTYYLPDGESARGIIQRMVDNFADRVARDHKEAIRRSGRPLSQIVTIASLIEREAQVPGDRARIASVIYNRLEKRMPLQIDATVQYARGEHKSRLLYRDLEIDSPYNTYRNAGLPPGPIANPGLASIEAALAPDKTPYLYYVARRDGSHLFGRTMDEHRANIARARREQGT